MVNVKDKVYSNIMIKERVEDVTDRKKRKSRYKKKISNLLDHNFSMIGITLITFTTLFGDDVRVVFFPKSLDYYIDGILMVCFIAFTVELVCSCLAKENYPWSFFFWLDIISLISMITDVYFLVEIFFGESSFIAIPTDATNVARAGKASRVGTKAGRLIKLMRLIRLIRVAKFYK